jgi:S1-C subfamily serine protease
MRRATCLAATGLACAALAGCGGDDDGAGGDADRSPGSGRQAAAAAPSAGAKGTLAQVPDLYRQLEPSVVSVLVRGAQGAGEGSGVVVRPQRIVTNQHVVAGGEEIQVSLASGERLDARLVGQDPRTDLAVLAVERDLPPAQLSEALPRVGSLAVAMGNPLGFEDTVTAGIVSGLDRSIPSGGTTPALVNLIQTDAPISPGNSGGALVGPDGTIIGINVAYIPPEARAVAIGFAIPAPTVRFVVEELLRDGTVEHAYLGVQLRPLTPEIAERLGVRLDEGAVIAAIATDGPGGRAGLRPGDVVVRAGDRTVASVEDVFAALRERRPGDELALEVVRAGQRRTVDVRLGELPAGG